MTVDAERKWITSALGWTCFLCTVAVLPAAAFDPINLPKLTVLTICALAILGLIFTNLQGLSSSFKRLPVFLIALFSLNLLAVLIFSGSDFYESFYGTFGRSTGFLNYLCLAILLFAGTQIQNALGFQRISFFLFVSGSVSLFYGILPFSMEVDQAFIAAILTIIGYSINDSVIIFDRLREWITLFPKRDLATNMNGGMNRPLGRTINTSGTTIFSAC